jgi:hypothetical protein
VMLEQSSMAFTTGKAILGDRGTEVLGENGQVLVFASSQKCCDVDDKNELGAQKDFKKPNDIDCVNVQGSPRPPLAGASIWGLTSVLP